MTKLTNCTVVRIIAIRFHLRNCLRTLVTGVLAALLLQSNAIGQLGFNLPYGEHDLSDPATIDTFKLHSNPGASKVIYMDFDGHIAPEWDDFVYDSFDLDGNPNSFSIAEKRMIRQSWQSLAEDFLPFDVDITTEDPGVDALEKSGPGDTEWGIRAVVSDTEGSGGWAYVGSFDESYDRMLYAGYNPSDTDWVEIGDMIAHEAGHALGLHHDSTAGQEYWTGHGIGDKETDQSATWYAPIMGWSWYGPSTWSKGEFNGATNTQDDLEVIANDAVGNPNGFGYRTDDHGSDTSSATPLTSGVLAEGIIERNTDLDYFSFTMSAAGNVAFDINPNNVDPTYSYGNPTPTGTVGANLDILAEIRDANDNVLYTSNPIEALNATFDVNLSAGDYFLSIDGTGKGNPATNGYSDYASLGYFSILGSGWEDLGIPGDFNGDGIVDGDDFLKWQRDDGSSAGLLEWESNFGTAAAAAAVIPEPKAISLILIGFAGMLGRRRFETNTRR